MDLIDAVVFDPVILYMCDPWSSQNHKGRNHSHDFIELSIVLEGEVNYRIADQTQTVMKNQLLLFNPGIEHVEWQRADTVSHQLHIGLQNVRLTEGKPNGIPVSNAVLSLGKNELAVLRKVNRIMDELTAQKSEDQEVCKALIKEILILILRSIEEEQKESGPKLTLTEKRQREFVNATIYYLESHYVERITLQQLADNLYVSPTYLSRIFKQETGESPISYLINIRLKRAEELLQNDLFTIKEVAKMVGYEDVYHFSKIFKKYKGKAPLYAKRELI